MGRRLNTYVTVGESTYGPDDDLPDDVADQINAPGVFDEDEPKKTEAKPRASKSA